MTETKPEKTTKPDAELVLVEDRGNWALVTLNRPEKRNAMNLAAQARFREALEQVHDKRVVVLTGVGAAFCSGIDLKEVASAPPTDGRVGGDSLRSWAECMEDIRKHPAVFIAAVNGFSLGGGSTLIHNCELAVAGESGSLGTPEVGFGQWPVLSGPSLINRALPKHAAEIIFIAKSIDSATAYRMGLVNEVVPDDQLMERAAELAEHIAKFDPVTLEWSKRGFRQMVNMSWEDSMSITQDIADAAGANRPSSDSFPTRSSEGSASAAEGA